MTETSNAMALPDVHEASQSGLQDRMAHTELPCAKDALPTSHDGPQQLSLCLTGDADAPAEADDLHLEDAAESRLASTPLLREVGAAVEVPTETDPQGSAQPEQNAPHEPSDASAHDEPTRRIMLPMNGEALMSRPLRSQTWFSPGLLTPGLGLLTADPKFGKTWMGFDLAMSMAMGGDFLGMQIEQGDALLVGLENLSDELHERADILRKAKNLESIPKGFWLYSKEDYNKYFHGPGDVEPLKHWIRSVPKPQLIIIDTLDLFVPRGGGSYRLDNQALHQLRFFAKEQQIMLMFIHHTNKTGKGIRAANGSQALTGNADVILVGNKPNEFASRATLSIMGNAIQQPRQLAMDFSAEKLAWQLVDPERDVVQNASRQALLEIMRDQNRPVTPRKLHEAALDVCIEPAPSLEVIRQQLMRMHKQNVLRRKPADSGQGYAYYLPEIGEEQASS